MFTCASLFAGMGGLCIGMERAGFKTLWANEFNEDCLKVYKMNFPDTKLIPGDIRKISVKKHGLEPVDVLHGGFPCQSFSGAGNRLGFEDERGMLFFEITRLIEEFGDDKPKVLVLENAPNLMIGANGDWIEQILIKLQLCGYWVSKFNCVLVDAMKNCGLPQRRERLFIIATSQDHFMDNPFGDSFPQVEREDIKNYLELDEELPEYYYLSHDNRFGTKLFEDLKDRPKYSLSHLRKTYARPVEYGVCPTLTANMGEGGHNVPFVLDHKGLRKLTEYECLKLQGFPENYRVPKFDDMPRSKVYKMVGNSVSPRVSTLLSKSVFDYLNENLNVNKLAV
jgi:DNA (cytosine-5)-methyltransferase 1